ncbi:MAG TPA: DUF4062 domain-containing protein [Gemmataceae bacterium]|nr:DUF4062 domain-containing protein [Gemmataceae bacterium]
MSPRAFVSSTYEDLKHHRAHVIRALRQADFSVDPMEESTSAADEPKRFCLERVEGCDLCVLLIAFRRGFVPEGESLSITQMEYDHALKHAIDVLPFILKEDAEWWQSDELAADEQLRQWRAAVTKRHGVSFFGPEPQSVEIAPALTRWLARRHERDRLRDYLAAVRAAHGQLNFLGLPQLKDNRDVRIDRLFVDPFLAPRYLAPESNPDEWKETVPLLDAVTAERATVLLGDPGTGKSTLVNWVAWQLAQERPNLWTAALENRVPIPLILRDLRVRTGVTWDGLLASFLAQPLGKHLDRERLERLLTTGQALVLLDGLDEIGSVTLRRDLRDAVQGAMLRYDRSRWLLTSRIVGYDDVSFHIDARELTHFPPDLARDARQLLTFLAGIRFIVPFNDRQIEQFAHNWYAEREAVAYRAREGAKSLVEAIHAEKATTRLARIPNLLTIMALIHRVRARLPHGKALLYNEIAQAYLETIDDYRKIRETNDTLADKKRWLARVGFEMQRQRSDAAMKSDERTGDEAQEILAGGSDVRGWIVEGMRASGQEGDEESARSFVEHIKRRSGLMIERAEEQFAFTHLSFQEYFAACYMAEQVTSPDWLADGQAGGLSRDDLSRYANSVLWREALVFLAELILAERPRWHRSLVDSLFGGDWRDLASAKEVKEPMLCLLARLASNPYALPTEGQREEASRLCCRWEVARQARGPWGWDWCHIPEVFRVLISGDPQEQAHYLKLLCDAVQAEASVQLTLTDTAVSDLTPLAALTGLQWLSLQRTAVSDLAPLAALTRLRTLFLNGTAVSDLAALATLTDLQWLYLPEGVGQAEIKQLEVSIPNLIVERL